MSYRVEYRLPAGKDSLSLLFLTAACFLIFLVLVYEYWPEGAEVIRAIWMEMKDSATVCALNYFAEELAKGETVKQAFSDFLEILQS